MRKAIITFALGCMCLVMNSGCAAWTDKSKNKDSMWSSMQFWKKPYQKPDKLAAIWTHDILTMSGKPPTRGFGGRLYFYNPKSQAIPVEGELIVHGYEEERIGLHVQAEKTKADKTFMFTAEQFTEHFSPSDLGASYSIWIPWDPADGFQKEITLIPTFKGKDGVILQGEPAKLVLPGRKPEDPFAAAAFQAVSYQTSQTPTNMGPLPQLNAPQQTGLRTTTISVPTNSRIGRDNSAQNSTNGNSTYNMNSSVKVTESTTGQTSGNMMYAGSSQAARAQAMYSALLNQQAQQGALQNSSLPANNANLQPQAAQAAPMLAGQQYQLQGPAAQTMTSPALPTQPTLPTLNSPASNGISFGASPRVNTTPASVPNNPLNSPLTNPLTNPGMMLPTGPTPTMPVMNMPNMQTPNLQTPNNPQWMIQQPGVATQYAPLDPGAVQAAFNAEPQLKSISQLQQAQWQSFGQTNNALTPNTQTSGANNGVQPALYNQNNLNQNQFNQAQPNISSGSAPVQLLR